MLIDAFDPTLLESEEWPATAAWLQSLPERYPHRGTDRNPVWALGHKRAAARAGRSSPVDHVALFAHLCDAAGPAASSSFNPLVVTELVAGATALPEPVARYLAGLERSIADVSHDHVTYPTALLLRERLAAHGIGERPAAGDWARWAPPSIDELWGADARVLGAVSHWFAACDASAPERIPAGTADALAAIMISACRRYELPLAAQLREALATNADKADLCRTADRFFLLQRSRHGFFGHVNPFTPLAQKPAEWADLDFRLPITVAVLGALYAC
ncbi:MAG: hypothetical protein JWM87_2456 [Candidatus Eremiobacteraeota bacterium]|nr:hypothetical protein [Candidatus Eremiobacteraeota bacterium]